VGKGGPFSSWDEAAEALARYNANAHPNYGHADWLNMAHRACREEDGAIRFDYDRAIATPFQTKGPVPRVDMWPLFKALGNKPLLVIRGALSDLLSNDALDRMHEAVPDMKSVTVPEVGHAPTLDEPEAAAAIDRFLNTVDV
jgi:pimeloyl-ACP methyl ester carboxylesterase